jgi:hypothetical protein
VAWLVAGWVTIAAGAKLETGDFFAAMRAASWFLFVHLPVLLVVVAVVARRERAWAAGLALAAVALVGVGVDAFLVEPHALELERFAIDAPGLERPLRIAVLSDVQVDDAGEYERSAFQRAADQRPDLILLPGDFVQQVDDTAYRAQVAAFRALLPLLRAPLGVWAVQGNVDWRRTWSTDLFGGTGVHAVRDTTTEGVGPIWLSALSFRDGFDPTLTLPRAPGYHVAFAHGPDFSLSPDVGADLLIAGHTHGGQVQLPLLGPPIVLSRVSRATGAGGVTELPGGRHLVVSRGVGMERGNAPRLRFRCRPEIVIVDLVPR